MFVDELEETVTSCNSDELGILTASYCMMIFFKEAFKTLWIAIQLHPAVVGHGEKPHQAVLFTVHS